MTFDLFSIIVIGGFLMFSSLLLAVFGVAKLMTPAKAQAPRRHRANPRCSSHAPQRNGRPM